MKRIMLQCLAGLLALLFTTVGNTRDMDDQYAVFGIGAEDCASYLVARDRGGNAERRYHHWLAGFLSAVNNAGAQTYNILGEKSMADILDWLEGYCSTNPNVIFSNAAADMVAILYPDRRNFSPNKEGGWNKFNDQQAGTTTP